jgi:prephenate dehydratase
MYKVAFQGERGAFSEDAAVAFFKEAEFVTCHNLQDVFEAVIQCAAEFGVAPAENSQAGSINETYDLLLEYPLKIYGEVNLRVHHYFMALKGAKLKDITTVYSHPQALAQCDQFLKNLDVEVIAAYNTAGAAKKIKEEALFGSAAIANRRAAAIYGLDILAEEIESNPGNFTKFFVISRKKAQKSQQSKTSIVFSVKNASGTLYTSLGVFALRGINLTKLESRPSKNKPWEYVFYVDFEGHAKDKGCREALIDLENSASFVKILGSYPSAQV